MSFTCRYTDRYIENRSFVWTIDQWSSFLSHLSLVLLEPASNDHFSSAVDRLAALGDMVEHFDRLGINAIYL